MKNRAIFFLIFLMVAEVLSSCSKNIAKKTSEGADNNISVQNSGEDTDMKIAALEESAAEDDTVSTAAQAFASVLRNEAVFSCTYNMPYTNRDIIHIYREYLKDITFGERPLNPSIPNRHRIPPAMLYISAIMFPLKKEPKRMRTKTTRNTSLAR